MKHTAAFLASILFFSFLNFGNADEIVRSGTGAQQNGRSQRISSESLAFGPYLKCLNQLGRIHPGISVIGGVPLEETQDLASDRNIFAGEHEGKNGVFVAAPSAMTFDEVQLTQPKIGTPFRAVSFKKVSGSDYSILFYFKDGSEEARGFTLTSGRPGESTKQKINYKPVGSSRSKISNADAKIAFENQLLPLFEKLPDYLQKLPVEGKERKTAATQTALCDCIQIQNTKIQEKVRDTAKTLNMTSKVNDCSSPLVSQLINFSSRYL